MSTTMPRKLTRSSSQEYSEHKYCYHTEEALGTSITIQLPRKHEPLVQLCVDEIKRIERTYSRFLNYSDLNRLNKKKHKHVRVSEEFFNLLLTAQQLTINTNGYFDIHVKTTLERLGYDANYSFKKKNKSLLQQLLKNRTQKTNSLIFNHHEQSVLIKEEIDLGGLGKGFALDQAATILRKHGVHQFIINAGGDILAGTMNNCVPWKILLEHPDDDQRVVGEVHLSNNAIASSSANRRTWADVHHLINPKTQSPSKGVKAIYVVSSQALSADAYSTALFVAGFTRAVKLTHQLPLEALIISEDNRVFQTKGFNAHMY